MKDQQQLMAMLLKKVTRYNRMAEKWGYATLWFDMRNHVITGGCMPKKEIADKGIFDGIMNVAKAIWLEWHYKRIMKINREERRLYLDEVKSFKKGGKRTI